jgi:serine/threonine-protein kinase
MTENGEGPGRYLVEEELGRGGQGIVYRAHDSLLERRVVLKRALSPSADPEGRELLLREARLMARLEHTNVTTLYDLGEDAGGQLFVSSRLIEGRTLGRLVSEEGDRRLDPDRLGDLLRVLLKVCEAVAYANSRRIVHRDLKPDNVMVGDFGQVHVIDWGLGRTVAAAVDAAGRVAEPDAAVIEGAPGWMAPEQARGAESEIGAHTDVFGLGALLYFVLTGRPPFGSDPGDALLRARSGAVIPISSLPEADRIPRPLATIAERALAATPADRQRSAWDFQLDLQRFLDGSWSFPIRRVASGAEIVREGDFGDEAYVVVSGVCEVLGESGAVRRRLRILEPGDAFGETALLTGSRRSATVRALTDVELRVVSADSLVEGLGLNGWLGRFVVHLAKRFREVDARLREREALDAGRTDPEGGGASP